jgi:hypothetical protein
LSELERHAVKGVWWTVVQAIGARALSFLVFVVLARLLAPADFGLIAMAAVFIELLDVLVQQGFSLVITQREKLEPEHEWTAFWTNLLLSALLGGGLWSRSCTTRRHWRRSLGGWQPSCPCARCRPCPQGSSNGGSTSRPWPFARSSVR